MPAQPATLQTQPHVDVFGDIAVIGHYLRMSILRHLPEDMTYTQFQMLSYFVRNGDGQTPAELARALLITKGAITSVLQKMVSKGHILVLSDVEDRRKKRVTVTKAGLEAASLMFKSLRSETGALRDAFTDREFRDALPFLKALRTFLMDLGDLEMPTGASH